GREDRERLREPGARLRVAALDAARRHVVDLGGRQEDGVEQLPVLLVDRLRVPDQEVVDLDAVRDLLEREGHRFFLPSLTTTSASRAAPPRGICRDFVRL